LNSKYNGYTCIIWDFNGTILDDVGIGIRSINHLLAARGLPTVDSRERYHEVFGFPIIEYYRRLGFDFEKESYDSIAVEWVEQYNRNRNCAEIYENIIGLLDIFKRTEKKQIILSATEYNMLAEQVSELGIDGYFSELVGLDNIKAESKENIALAWRKKNPGEKILFIGDTDHDLNVARAIGADCVLIADGHQDINYLSTLGTRVFENAGKFIKDVVCDM